MTISLAFTIVPEVDRNQLSATALFQMNEGKNLNVRRPCQGRREFKLQPKEIVYEASKAKE